MTPKQHELLKFITAYLDKHGISPNFDEMRDALGLRSKAGVHRLLGGLHEQGRITQVFGRSRSVLPVADNGDHLSTAALIAALEKRGILIAKGWQQ